MVKVVVAIKVLILREELGGWLWYEVGAFVGWLCGDGPVCDWVDPLVVTIGK